MNALIGASLAARLSTADTLAHEDPHAPQASRTQFETMTKDLEAQDRLGNFEIQDLMSTYNQAETLSKDGLTSQDRLGNFEIQRLMSAYNQAETLSSNVQKKQDDANNAVIGKIG